jgi:hypothetical protein
MLQLIKKVRAAATSDLTMDWLQPFMHRRSFRRGDVLFRKGDLADRMFLAEKGKFVVSELGIELRAGQIFGQMAADVRLTPNCDGRVHGIWTSPDDQLRSSAGALLREP